MATWWKDGVQFTPNWDSRISVSPLSQSGNFSYVTTLTVISLNTGDSGTYSCRATLNGAQGNAIANATVYKSITIEGIRTVTAFLISKPARVAHLNTMALVSDLPWQLFQIHLTGLENNILLHLDTDSLCRDSANMPILCAHTNASPCKCSKPFQALSYPIQTFLYPMVPLK